VSIELGEVHSARLDYGDKIPNKRLQLSKALGTALAEVTLRWAARSCMARAAPNTFEAEAIVRCIRDRRHRSQRQRW